MQFHIRYRNTQGTLMRILNAVSRRGLDLPAVHAEAAELDHQVMLTLEVNQKQVGQLYREWYGIPDVIRVGSGAAHALTSDDFERLAHTYGRIGGLDRAATVIKAVRAERGHDRVEHVLGEPARPDVPRR